MADDAPSMVREYAARVLESFRRLFVSPSALSGASHDWVSADSTQAFWFIQTYHDLARLRRTLQDLRRLYPESHVLVVSDGDPNPDIPRVCQRYSAGFSFRERLYGVERGGELVQKILDEFLRTDADVLVKIDPDTRVRRRFSVLPFRTATSIFGTVQSVGSGVDRLESIQGGCIIVPRQAAIELTRSGLLHSDRLKPPALEWAVTEGLMARAARGLTSSDHALGWACRELGLSCRDHPEVFSRYLPHLVDTLTDWRMAVSHPRFELRQASRATFYFGGLVRARRMAARGRT